MSSRKGSNSGGTAEIRAAADNAVLVYLGREISRRTHERVWRLVRRLETDPLPGVVNVHPAYCSVLVKFDLTRARHEEMESALRRCVDELEDVKLPDPCEIEIPVCYGGEFGPDMEDVCALHALSEKKLISLHSDARYFVCFLGFVPGFAYLGGLDPRLATPRLDQPRREVPAGSVGIAGNQTGVYPFATPGGWRLIGRTPTKMLRPDGDRKSLLAIGDRVRFVPISREQFAELEHR